MQNSAKATVDFEEEALLGEVPIGGGKTLRVRRLRIHGHPRIDLRLFVENDEAQLLPTRKGVMIPPKAVAEVAEILKKAAEETPSEADQPGTSKRKH